MLNEVRIIGNLGRDPEIKRADDGSDVRVRLSIATTRTWTDSAGKPREETEWHRVTVWGKAAEAVFRTQRKGSQVHVSGRLRTSSFDKDGVKTYSTEIVAERVLFLGKRAGGADGGQ